jgi:hypothetical protein
VTFKKKIAASVTVFMEAADEVDTHEVVGVAGAEGLARGAGRGGAVEVVESLGVVVEEEVEGERERGWRKDSAGEADVVVEADLCGDFEYDEDDPELWLLQQDLVALHKRGAEMVTVTILTSDQPPDVSCLLWPYGSGHLDLALHYADAVPYPQERILKSTFYSDST